MTPMAHMSTDGEMIPPCTACGEEEEANVLPGRGIGVFRRPWADLLEKRPRPPWPQNQSRTGGGGRFR